MVELAQQVIYSSRPLLQANDLGWTNLPVFTQLVE